MTDNHLLAQAVAAESDNQSTERDISRWTQTLSQLTTITEPVKPEGARPNHQEAVDAYNDERAARYQQNLAGCQQLAAELGKALSWSATTPGVLNLWMTPDMSGNGVEAQGDVQSMFTYLRNEVARRQGHQQLIEAKEQQRQRDRQQYEEAKRADARRVLEASGYAEENAALRDEISALRDEIAQLRELIRQPSAPGDETSATPEPSPESETPIVPDDAADESGEGWYDKMRALQAEVIRRVSG
jgi:hypothetical protein